MEEIQLGNLIALISANVTILWIYFKGEEYLKKLRDGFKIKKSNFHSPCFDKSKEILTFLKQNYTQNPDGVFVSLIFEEDLETEKFKDQDYNFIIKENIIKQIKVCSPKECKIIYECTKKDDCYIGTVIMRPLIKFLHERNGRPQGGKIIEFYLKDDFILLNEVFSIDD